VSAPEQAPQSRAEATRGRLLDAAVTAFAEKGFHATTTRDIAGAAGMSPAAVYVHHKSKEELLYLISSHGHQITLDLVREARATTESPADQLFEVARAFAEYHAHRHVVSRTVTYELAALSEEHRTEITGLRKAIDAEFRDLVNQGVAAGVFNTPDPALAATALASLGIDIARWYREDGRWTPAYIADFYADLALRMVGVAR
jgi:AcrR family transcriptional regulator